MFRIKRGTCFDINAVEFTLAGAFLIRGNYTEGYKKLKTIRDFYFEKAEEYKSNDIWLFSTKADYIDKLLKILENRSENWENKLQNEIVAAEGATVRCMSVTDRLDTVQSDGPHDKGDGPAGEYGWVLL